jgi:hypothetical protein
MYAKSIFDKVAMDKGNLFNSGTWIIGHPHVKEGGRES